MLILMFVAERTWKAINDEMHDVFGYPPLTKVKNIAAAELFIGGLAFVLGLRFGNHPHIPPEDGLFMLVLDPTFSNVIAAWNAYHSELTLLHAFWLLLGSKHVVKHMTVTSVHVNFYCLQ